MKHVVKPAGSLVSVDFASLNKFYWECSVNSTLESAPECEPQAASLKHEICMVHGMIILNVSLLNMTVTHRLKKDE